MSGHTPGPWLENGNSDWFPDRYEGKGSSQWTVIRSDSEDRDVAIVMVPLRWADDEKRLDANAHLIAAAPCLLEALTKLLRELDWVNEQLDLMPDDYAEAQVAARTAIARATGEVL